MMDEWKLFYWWIKAKSLIPKTLDLSARQGDNYFKLKMRFQGCRHFLNWFLLGKGKAGTKNQDAKTVV